jgi:hypothetical protein
MQEKSCQTFTGGLQQIGMLGVPYIWMLGIPVFDRFAKRTIDQ